MRRIFRRVALAIAFITASCIGGWYLGALLALIPFEMPVTLYRMIRTVLVLTGHDELDNLDDIETIALAGMIAVCCCVVALVLAAVWLLAGRYVKRRRMRMNR